MRIDKTEKGLINLNKIFNDLLNHWCEVNGKKQVDFAHQIDVNQQTVSQWKTGSNSRRPPFSVIMTLLVATDRAIVIDKKGINIVEAK